MKMTDVEFARVWLQKANHDLQAARYLLPEAAQLADVICFHAQQAIEKTFKGVCTAHSIRFEKTHDLIELLGLVLPFIPSWEEDRPMLGVVSTYAVDLRYPGSPRSPSTEMTHAAIDIATRILTVACAHVDAMETQTEGEPR